MSCYARLCNPKYNIAKRRDLCVIYVVLNDCFTEHIWPVTVKPKGLGNGKVVSPTAYRLCLTNQTLSLIRPHEDKSHIVFQVCSNLWWPCCLWFVCEHVRLFRLDSLCHHTAFSGFHLRPMERKITQFPSQTSPQVKRSSQMLVRTGCYRDV